MIKPTFNPRYKNAKHGIFKPSHPEKYKGFGQIVFKSFLEAKMMFYLDNDPKCIAWWAEPFAIKYFDKSTNRWRSYFIDFVFEMMDGSSKKIYWVETKTVGETKKPTGARNTQALLESTKVYVKNLCKWSAAQKAAKKHGANFVVITEEFFKKNKKFKQ